MRPLDGAGGARHDPASPTIVARVLASALEHPDLVAVRDAAAALTFTELSAGVVELGDALRHAGIGPGDLVGVTASRDRRAVLAMLAVLSTGAAFVPLEPTLPLDRLQAIVDDASLRLCLVSDDQDSGPALHLPSVSVDDVLAGRGSLAPAPRTAPVAEGLAYVIFTSGSTGRPKGVQITHGSVLNLLDHMAREPGLRAGEVMLGVTTPAFDLAVPDLFLPLITGATLVLAPRSTVVDGVALRRLIEREHPDLMQATPSTWRLLLSAGWPGDPRLRAVCGGEGYEAALARTLAGQLAGVWNFYGPTETTVWSVFHRLDPRVADPIPIGVPIDRTTCEVIDANGVPVPPGETGELVISGAGVSVGYLHRSDLDAISFVPDSAGRRAFRTGDFVRADAQGCLTFVERRDGQVKIRGYRVELGDIETALRSCAGVGQAVAVVIDQPARHVVAVVVPTDASTSLDAASVTTAVAARLPDYMVPARVEVRAVLPLTPNGKVDRRALAAAVSMPTPGGTDLSTDPDTDLGTDLTPASPDFAHDVADSIDPDNVIEQLLAQQWTEILGVRVHGRHDDFFALGADSLAATRAVARVEATFGVSLGVVDVFRAPTIAGLALSVMAAMMRIEELAGDDGSAGQR